MSDIGPMEIVALLLLALLLFGAKRLPEIGRSLGTGMREFKSSISGVTTAGDVEESRSGVAAAAPGSVDVAGRLEGGETGSG